MGLWVPNGSGDFLWRKSNVEGVRPVQAYGTTITVPGSANTKGSYATALGALAFDVYGIFIRATDVFFNNTTGTDTLIDIGVDPAGGTSFTVIIPDLQVSGASGLTHAGGQNFYFPLWIKAGSSIGIRAASVKTANTFGVEVCVFGKPHDPKLIKAGTYVASFGVSAGTSTGTAVTCGTTSDGAWTQIGSATTKDYWWFQIAKCAGATATLDLIYKVDLAVGDASNKRIVIQEQFWSNCPSGALATPGSGTQGACYSKTGDNIYVRAQCSGAADGGTGFSVYALGG
jgi:hypothetical protein